MAPPHPLCNYSTGTFLTRESSRKGEQGGVTARWTLGSTRARSWREAAGPDSAGPDRPRPGTAPSRRLVLRAQGRPPYWQTLLPMSLGGYSGEMSTEQTENRAVPSPRWTGHPIHRGPEGNQTTKGGAFVLVPPLPLALPPPLGLGRPSFLLLDIEGPSFWASLSNTCCLLFLA